MTKTAKIDAQIETARTEAESTVKSLFRVVDKAKTDGYAASARGAVASAADTVKDKSATLRDGAGVVVDVVEAGAAKAVEGVAGLGQHIVAATYANVVRTADMVKDLSAATSFGDAYKVEAEYVRSIVKQNLDQISSGVSIIRNVFSATVQAAKDERKSSAAA